MIMNTTSRFPGTIVTTLCVFAAGHGLLFAGTPKKPTEEHGIIASVDTTAHTLFLKPAQGSSVKKFQWNDATKFSTRDTPTNAGALKQGEKVHITYQPDASPRVMQSVQITPKQSESSHPKKTKASKSQGT